MRKGLHDGDRSLGCASQEGTDQALNRLTISIIKYHHIFTNLELGYFGKVSESVMGMNVTTHLGLAWLSIS